MDNLLDEAAPLAATIPPIDDTSDALCPVQIQVHDPAIREQRRFVHHRDEKRYQRTVNNHSKKWIDLDKNVLDNYILIDDVNLGPSVPEIDREEMPYPEKVAEYDDDDEDDDQDGNKCVEDHGSHSKREWSIYEQSKNSASKHCWPDFDFSTIYPIANSHGDTYQDPGSHSKYPKLYSEFRAKDNNLGVTRDLDVTSYSIANSHGEKGRSAANISNNRGCRESNNLAWDTKVSMNYEIANSHSNYHVFYDSQAQYQCMIPSWASQLRTENSSDQESRVVTLDKSTNDTVIQQDNNKAEKNVHESKKHKHPAQASYDIEQCLMQIEESLLNIEQNLLHVQDLDIPEMKNLLYKSPSIERSLYEVQDLLSTDDIIPVATSSKSASLDSNKEEEEEEEEKGEQEEEIWIQQKLTIKNNDGDMSVPQLNSPNEEISNATNIDEYVSPTSVNDYYVDWFDEFNVPQEQTENLRTSSEKTINFVPNSLSETLPRTIILDKVKNIKLCSSESERSSMTMDYNLNSTYANEKSLLRDKCHSRTNSLDENSIFQNLEFSDRRKNDKVSLRDILYSESSGNHLMTKARSEGTLQIDRSKSLRAKRRGSHEMLLQAVKVTAEDFRKKLEDFASQRLFILDRQKRTLIARQSLKEIPDISRFKERSKRTIITTTKTQSMDNSGLKNISCEKQKKKKTSEKTQKSPENALLPNKLISLSLSLLLAALLQAVRCLTSLVEDAFRSVSFDRSGLLQ